MSAKVLSDVVPQNDIRAPQELASRRIFAPRSGSGGEVSLRAGPSSFLDRVITREAWGADESLRFKDGVDQWLTAFVTPSLLVVHHTAGEGDVSDAEADVRAIYAYHAVTRGWGDIGYNLLIDSSGQRLRRPAAVASLTPVGQREIVSESVVAGHALDYNYGSVGIALLGNFQERAARHRDARLAGGRAHLHGRPLRHRLTAIQDYVRAQRRPDGDLARRYEQRLRPPRLPPDRVPRRQRVPAAAGDPPARGRGARGSWAGRRYHARPGRPQRLARRPRLPWDRDPSTAAVQYPAGRLPAGGRRRHDRTAERVHRTISARPGAPGPARTR